MLIWPDCIVCTLRMVLSVARTVLRDETRLMELMRSTLTVESLVSRNAPITAPDIVRDVWLKLVDLAGDPDPLRELKHDQNKRVLELYPTLKKTVLEAADPLKEAVRLAIAGNAIDTMAEALSKPADQMIAELSGQRLDPGDFDDFLGRLRRAGSLLYFGDNCGEIVFDRIVIETIRETMGKEVVFVVRSIPVMNDATPDDARSVGIDRVAPVIGNGIPEPYPGTRLDKSSPEVQKLVRDADLIILKGGGNYDSMTEETSIRGRATFLFQAKCHPFATTHRVPLGSLVIYNM